MGYEKKTPESAHFAMNKTPKKRFRGLALKTDFFDNRKTQKEMTTMTESLPTVTLHGNPLNLEGTFVQVGDTAPDVALVDNALKVKTLRDFAGSPLILLSVPSLDTPVCDMETRRFNAEAANLHPDMKILTVSMDLPFAQSRWCGAAGVDKVITLSDHRFAGFGKAFGVLIPDLRLLARAVFVLDREHRIRYVQRVTEISEEPDYAAVLAAAKTLN